MTMQALRSAWRLQLPRPVLALQAGNVINTFGFGLILPFEIIYLHRERGFSTATAGLVLSTVMATAALSTPPIGALVDKLRPKAILFAGSLATAAGYGLLAFVHHPWQAFACSLAAGIGQGAGGAAAPTLMMTLVTREERAPAMALSRVAVNLGIGTGGVLGGFIIASGHGLHAFQALYLFDALTFVGYAVVVALFIPGGAATAESAEHPPGNFRRVIADRTFMGLLAANVLLTIVGYSFFANIMPPFITAETRVGAGGIGVLFLVNTAFIVIAQLPAAQLVKRYSNAGALVFMTGLWTLASLGVLAATAPSSAGGAIAVLVVVSIAFGVGECIHFVVLGPMVVDLAPPNMLGRYMSTYGVSFIAGLALGPTVGGALLGASPDSVWIVAAGAAIAAGALLYRLCTRPVV
jgi:MFS family permease